MATGTAGRGRSGGGGSGGGETRAAYSAAPAGKSGAASQSAVARTSKKRKSIVPAGDASDQSAGSMSTGLQSMSQGSDLDRDIETNDPNDIYWLNARRRNPSGVNVRPIGAGIVS